MIIYLATDHRGFKLKEKIKKWLKRWNYQYEDMGAFSLDENDDYPDFISKAAERVSKNPGNDKGIILGSSGQGEAIVANKYPGVRAVVYYGEAKKVIKLTREHNDANILSLGVSFLREKEAKKTIEDWLKTEFSGALRHKRRINKIKKIEK